MGRAARKQLISTLTQRKSTVAPGFGILADHRWGTVSPLALLDADQLRIMPDLEGALAGSSYERWPVLLQQPLIDWRRGEGWSSRWRSRRCAPGLSGASLASTRNVGSAFAFRRRGLARRSGRSMFTGMASCVEGLRRLPVVIDVAASSSSMARMVFQAAMWSSLTVPRSSQSRVIRRASRRMSSAISCHVTPRRSRASGQHIGVGLRSICRQGRASFRPQPQALPVSFAHLLRNSNTQILNYATASVRCPDRIGRSRTVISISQPRRFRASGSASRSGQVGKIATQER